MKRLSPGVNENVSIMGKYHDLLDSIFNTVPVPIYVKDLLGRYLLINSAGASLLGKRVDEIIGRDDSELVSEDIAEEIQKRDRSVINSGIPRTFEEIIHKDRTKCTFLSVKAPCRDENGNIKGIIGISHDISLQKQLWSSMQDYRIESQLIFDSIPVMIDYKDTEGKYIRVNNEFSEILGIPKEEIEGKMVSDIMPDYSEVYWELDREIIETGKEKKNVIMVLETGDETRWIRVSKIPNKDEKGSIIGVISFAVDITEIMKYEELIEERTKELIMNNKILNYEISKRKSIEEELTNSINGMQKIMEGVVNVIALTVEKRDPYTAGHQKRVAEIAVAIAEDMDLPMDQINGILMAGTIHDLGKIAIPAEILSKPSRLTEIEFSLIKTHPEVGYEISKNIDFPWPIAEMIYQHHERYNGKGYPRGITGDEMLLGASIIAVADVVEAMSSHRPYRPALGIEIAKEEILKNRGISYQPEVVDSCLKVLKEEKFEFIKYAK